MRLFETSGIPQNSVKITFNTPIKISQVKETDLLERDINSDINILDKNEIIANFSKFEIKTIKITISS